MGIPTKVPIELVNPTPAASTDLSNYVDLTSAQTISGSKTVSSNLTLNGRVYINSNNSIPTSPGIKLTGNAQNSAIIIQNTSISKGTAPTNNISNIIEFFGSTITDFKNRMGFMGNTIDTNNISKVRMSAYGCGTSTTTTACEISCNVDASGNVYTSAPTPATSDNSTKIATTAFVNNRLPYETGTWTPTLSGSTTAGAFTYSYTGSGRGCYYIKFGNLVFLRAAFTYTVTTAPAGEVRINGAPFVSDSYYSGLGGGNNRRWDSCQIPLNASYIRPRAFNSSTGISPIVSWGSSDGLGTWLNTVNSNDWIIFNIWYGTSS